MKIELDFVPNVIIYACFFNGSHHFDRVWGDKNVLEYGKDYIKALLPKENCFFFAEKGLGKYQVILGKIDD